MASSLFSSSAPAALAFSDAHLSPLSPSPNLSSFPSVSKLLSHHGSISTNYDLHGSFDDTLSTSDTSTIPDDNESVWTVVSRKTRKIKQVKPIEVARANTTPRITTLPREPSNSRPMSSNAARSGNAATPAPSQFASSADANNNTNSRAAHNNREPPMPPDDNDSNDPNRLPPIGNHFCRSNCAYTSKLEESHALLLRLSELNTVELDDILLLWHKMHGNPLRAPVAPRSIATYSSNVVHQRELADFDFALSASAHATPPGHLSRNQLRNRRHNQNRDPNRTNRHHPVAQAHIVHAHTAFAVDVERSRAEDSQTDIDQAPILIVPPRRLTRATAATVSEANATPANNAISLRGPSPAPATYVGNIFQTLLRPFSPPFSAAPPSSPARTSTSVLQPASPPNPPRPSVTTPNLLAHVIVTPDKPDDSSNLSTSSFKSESEQTQGSGKTLIYQEQDESDEERQMIALLTQLHKYAKNAAPCG